MAKNVLVGVNNIAKKPRNIYVGVDGKAKRVKEAYVGVDGIAKKVWPSSVLPTGYTQLEHIDLNFYTAPDIEPKIAPRVVMSFSFNEFTFDWHDRLNLVSGAQGATFSSDTGYLTYDCFLERINGDFTGFNFWWFYQHRGSDQQISERFYGNQAEKILVDTVYTLDFLNNGRDEYLYNTEGYYSIASHNYVGSFSGTIPDIPSSYQPNPSYSTRNFGIGGWPKDTYSAVTPRQSHGKLFYVKIYNGSTLIRDLYPCYVDRGRYLGLYDNVNRIFYTSYVYGSGFRVSRTYEEAISDGYDIGPIV